MAAITFISFGKLKTPGLRETADYYLKRIATVSAGMSGARRLTVSEVELKPVPVPDKSPETRLRIQAQESKLLLERVDRLEVSGGGAVLILLDETGRALPTDKWAAWMAQETGPGSGGAVRPLVFAIGSSLGFGGEVRARARFTFSLGPQTLPHELARVVLIEQVYRALSVNAGHPYHNAGM